MGYRDMTPILAQEPVFGEPDSREEFGLHDRASIRRLTETCFSTSDVRQSHALFIIDANTSRQFSGTEGHPFGDAALKDIAATLRRTFRRSDCIGRLDADAFLVLLKDVQIGRLSEKRGHEFCSALKALSAAQGKNAPACSIGVAAYPENGTTFEAVYACADAARHKARDCGRNQVVFALRKV